MKVQIQRHIATADYAHYPGQVLIDHPHEDQWLKNGDAIPVPEDPEIAVAVSPETRKRK